ncbi:protein bassoon-like [Thunnus thynnus]|uniref:protein bassoon-like n=1 Tax=Thunnus thynnus TaxID=8237 RepID=UPI003527E508
MQRALGIDMTTPRSKSQQQIHSPSHQAKPIVQPQQPAPQPTQPTAAAQPKPLAQNQPTQRQQQQQQQHPPSQPYGQTQPYSQSQQYPQSQPQSYPLSQPGPQTQPHTSPGLQRHPAPGGPQTQTGPSQQGMRSDPYSQRGPGAPGAVGGPAGGPSQPGGPRIPHPGAVPLPGLTKAPSQPDLGRGSPMHQSMARHHDQTRSAGSSPAHRPQSQAPPPAQDGLTKLFGFGASLLNQASTLINVDPLPTASTQPSPARGKVVFSNATPDNRQQQQGAPGAKPFGMGGPHAPTQMGGPHAPSQMGGPYASSQMVGPQSGGPHAPTHKQTMPHQQGMSQQQSPVHHQKGPQQPQGHQHQQAPAHLQKAPQKQEPVAAPAPAPEPVKPKVNCPLCKTELNIGSSDPPNYNSCTQCHSQVCNLCGFNPTPHLVEVRGLLYVHIQYSVHAKSLTHLSLTILSFTYI